MRERVTCNWYILVSLPLFFCPLSYLPVDALEPSFTIYLRKELKEREGKVGGRKGERVSEPRATVYRQTSRPKTNKKIRPRASDFHCTNAFFWWLVSKHQMGTCWCRCSLFPLVSCTNNYLDGDLWTFPSSSLLENKTTRSSSLKGK
jgi:hypothetical protein